MSEKYKTTEDGLYFVSFSVVGFIDVFTRRLYQEILVESFIFCQLEKGPTGSSLKLPTGSSLKLLPYIY